MKQLFLFILVLLFSEIRAQVISSSRSTDWSKAGYEGVIPNPPVVIDITAFGGMGDSVTDNYSFIQNAISSLNGTQGVIYFPAGNYLIQATLNLPDSIVLRGSSSDSTHLIFDFAGVVANNINIAGSANFSFTNVLSGIDKGSSQLVVADTSGFNAGGYAEIQEDNGTWDTQPVSWANHSIGQIIRIDSISGDTLFFSDPLRVRYDSAMNVQVRKFIPAKEVGIECLNLYRRDSVASGFCVGIYFDHAVNCWVHGVESSRSVGSHIEITGSSHIEISGSYVHHSFAYDGTSTHGYGITLNKHASGCKLENNIMRHLRHSFSMQCGANGNVIAYNYSIDPNRSEFPANFGADISMHGHYTFSNLFEGNIVQNIQVDSIWGPTGPFNTFFRNRAELYGIFMISGTVSSDSGNFVGNEITNTGLFMGNYIIAGNGHFEYGNNQAGTIIPSGTTALNDSSCYLTSVPGFWIPGSAFPSLGEPNVLGSGSIPASDRYLSGYGFTTCSSQVIPTGAVEIFQDDILVFPNPASDILTVTVPRLSSIDTFTIEIFNTLGQKVSIEKKQLSISKSEISLDISELETGIYFVKVKNEGNYFSVKKIMKQ